MFTFEPPPQIFAQAIQLSVVKMCCAVRSLSLSLSRSYVYTIHRHIYKTNSFITSLHALNINYKRYVIEAVIKF